MYKFKHINTDGEEFCVAVWTDPGWCFPNGEHTFSIPIYIQDGDKCRMITRKEVRQRILDAGEPVVCTDPECDYCQS